MTLARPLTLLLLVATTLSTFAVEPVTPLVLPFFDSADLSPRWADDSGEGPAPGSHRIGDFQFTNQQNQTVTRADLLGSIHVADFFFTSCPGICATLTRNLKRVQDATEGRDVALISYSVTPRMDTPEVLAAYALRFGVDNKRWHLTTGDKEATYALARESYFADGLKNQGKGSETFLHTENLFLVDAQGRIRGVYNGTRATDVTRLIEDIAHLRAEMQDTATPR
ncbi:SCO family protein [Acanthopleuribacter pedis]|uniref:SCO family protein n=1 Tax=Acanthopleuribacter pedis TaxID=442870 RepID=A0A8J7U8J7_9BACT|nr:SCO family protein [Acanthopleuribacter pedis]MBO1322626.1 SCO family protein [Acanthopleuribacter pedis]